MHRARAPTLSFGVGPAYVQTRGETSALGRERPVEHRGLGVIASGSFGAVFRGKYVSWGPEVLVEAGSIPFSAVLQFAIGWSEGLAGRRRAE